MTPLWDVGEYFYSSALRVIESRCSIVLFDMGVEIYCLSQIVFYTSNAEKSYQSCNFVVKVV